MSVDKELIVPGAVFQFKNAQRRVFGITTNSGGRPMYVIWEYADGKKHNGKLGGRQYYPYFFSDAKLVTDPPVPEDKGNISDGYHTFNELYEHRFTLWIALCKQLYNNRSHRDVHSVWRTETHSDGSKYDGWFLLGVNDAHGTQMTYHLPMSKWSVCDFAGDCDRAPDYDGHTSADVLERIRKL